MSAERYQNKPLTPAARAYQEALKDTSPDGRRRLEAMQAKAQRTREVRRTEAERQAALEQDMEEASLEHMAAARDERRDKQDAVTAQEMVDRGVLAIDPETGEYRTIYEQPED